MPFIALNANMVEDEKNFELNPALADQLGAWLDKVIENNPSHWTVVTHHQGNDSMAQK